jgi:L-threonate 2-dehydrogenase
VSTLATQLGAVALVGAGAIGLAMARRLRSLGVAVRVHDVDPARGALARDAGCSTWPDAAAAAAGCRFAIVAVVDAAQTEAVLFGGGATPGLQGALAPGATVLLCPTLSPETVQHCGERLGAAGLAVLDAPMSGGPARAEAGTMSLMLAGSAATLGAAEPLLAALATHRFVIGSRLGDAARTKLVNNLLAAAHLAAAAEALQLAQAMGLEAGRTLDVVAASSGASWIALDRARRHLAGDRRVHARIAMLAKDSALAAEMAAPLGGLGPLGEAARQRFAQALAAGLADADDSAVLSLRFEADGSAAGPAAAP